MAKKETVNTMPVSLEHISSADLNIDIASIKQASDESFSTWMRVLMLNWRQGTVGCKDRGEVNRTNKKPWKQKGTGRARAGTARSPLWKGGGVIFGPQARVRTLKMPRKSKKQIMLTLLAKFIEEKNVVCADWELTSEKPKTSEAQTFLQSSNLRDKKIVLFVAPYDFQTALSFANISNVNPLSFDQPNGYDLANSNCWLVLKKDLDHFKGMVSQWL